MAKSGTLNNFLQEFKYGFVHPNLFSVSFTANPLFDTYGTIMSAACKSAQIPGVTFTEGQYYHEGFYNKFVSGADYDPFTLVFLVDGGSNKSESKVISCLDKWSTLIFNDGKYGFKKDYTCDVTFKMNNRDGTELYTSTVIEAYPTNITAFELSYDSKFNVMEYPITFNFLKFKVDKT